MKDKQKYTQPLSIIISATAATSGASHSLRGFQEWDCFKNYAVKPRKATPSGVTVHASRITAVRCREISMFYFGTYWLIDRKTTITI